MNDLVHQQVTREAVKARFGSHQRLRCKTTLQYPVSVEREYQRITNAYMKLLNDTLKKHLPEIRAAASREEATRHDDIGDLVSLVQQAFLDMGVELDNSTQRFGLRQKVERMANLTRKLSIKEWKYNLTPEEMDEAVKLFKARRADGGDPAPGDPKQDGGDPPPKKADGEDCPKQDGADPKKDGGDAPGSNTDGGDPVKMVKDRRDSRKSDGDPKDTDSAKKVIAQQDADIDALLKVIEQMKAKSDFDSAPAVKKDGEDCAKTDGGDKGKAMNADSVDAIVQERISLLRLGDRLNLDGTDGMSIPQLKRAIIKAVKPSLRLDGQSEVYIDAAFAIARDEVEARKDTNYQRRQMFNMDAAPKKAPEPAGATARRHQMIEDMDGGNE